MNKTKIVESLMASFLIGVYKKESLEEMSAWELYDSFIAENTLMFIGYCLAHNIDSKLLSDTLSKDECVKETFWTNVQIEVNVLKNPVKH